MNPHTVRMDVDELCGNVQRYAGLGDAARAIERGNPMFGKQRAHLGDFHFTTDDGRPRKRQFVVWAFTVRSEAPSDDGRSRPRNRNVTRSYNSNPASIRSADHGAMPDALLPRISGPDRATIGAIETTLRRFGPGALRVAHDARIGIVALSRNESYRDRSRVLRRLAAGVDDWPIPPAGLFVVEERTMYLRSPSPMTVAHEFAHALDCALGCGIYLSGVDPRIRRAFENATAFVTPYAASGLDEYFAEALRAWVEANDAHSLWPRATRARLRAVDAPMYTIVQSLFERELALPNDIDTIVS